MAKSPRNAPRLAARAKGRRKRAVVKQPNEQLFLGQWIARLGREQNEVSIAAGMGKSYVNLLISGKRDNPSAVRMLRISRALGVTVNDLYEPPPSRSDMENLQRYRPQTIQKLMEANRLEG